MEKGGSKPLVEYKYFFFFGTLVLKNNLASYFSCHLQKYSDTSLV